MGLDTSHNAWHGPYSSFGHWRNWVAIQLGLPPLDLMEGFYTTEHDTDNGYLKGYGNPFYHAKLRLTGEEYKDIQSVQIGLPIKWSCLKEDPIHELLNHSDCEGDIPWESCGKIAERLKHLLNNIQLNESSPDTDFINDYLINKTKQFMEGCQLAFEKRERLEFH